jgi:hypothetical protein
MSLFKSSFNPSSRQTRSRGRGICFPLLSFQIDELVRTLARRRGPGPLLAENACTDLRLIFQSWRTPSAKGIFPVGMH